MKYLKRFESIDSGVTGRYWNYVHPQKEGIDKKDSQEHINEIEELLFDIIDKYNLERVSSQSATFKKSNYFLIQDEHKDNYINIHKGKYFRSKKVQFEYSLRINADGNDFLNDLSLFINKLNNVGYNAYYAVYSDNYKHDTLFNSFEKYFRTNPLYEENASWYVNIKILVE